MADLTTPLSPETALTALFNEIAESPNTIILVLSSVTSFSFSSRFIARYR